MTGAERTSATSVLPAPVARRTTTSRSSSTASTASACRSRNPRYPSSDSACRISGYCQQFERCDDLQIWNLLPTLSCSITSGLEPRDDGHSRSASIAAEFGDSSLSNWMAGDGERADCGEPVTRLGGRDDSSMTSELEKSRTSICESPSGDGRAFRDRSINLVLDEDWPSSSWRGWIWL